MSNDTKAAISIFSICVIFFLLFVGYKWLEYIVNKKESLIESFNNNEEIYCSNDSKWMLVSKSQDWKLVGYHFIKDDIVFDFGDCEKNNKVTKNADPKRN